MKENKHIKEFAKTLFLRKSLYYSILWLFLSTILVLIIVGYNYLYLPDLKVIRLLAVSAGILLLLINVLFPLRYFVLTLLSPWLSDYGLGYLLSRYDHGLFLQASQLKKEGVIGIWSSKKVKLNSELILTKTLPTLKKKFNVKKGLVLLITLVGIVLFIPRSPVIESSKELIFGNLRRSFNDSIIKDTVHVNYKKSYNTEAIRNQGFVSTGTNDVFTIEKDTILSWKYLNRKAKEQYIICDSLPVLASWSASIKAPEYLNIEEYSVQDTVMAYPGSTVELKIKGVLVDLFKIKVSRGTYRVGDAFRITAVDTAVSVFHLKNTIQIPVKLILDKFPVINVIENNTEYVRYTIKDDFIIQRVQFNDGKITTVNISQLDLQVSWNNRVKMELRVWDNHNQSIKTSTVKPMPLSSELLLNVATGISRKSERFQDFKANKQNTSENTTKLGVKQELKQQTNAKDEKVFGDRNETKEDLINQLDILWKTEQLIELLEGVDTTSNKSLDTALFELSNQIIQKAHDKNIKEVSAEVLKIPEIGEERLEKAKESIQKLKEILNEETASIQSDNVERLKRLLKGSWSVSVLQEQLGIDPQERKVKQQRALLELENFISDTVDVIMVSDQALNLALTANREELDNALFSFRHELETARYNPATIGYLVKALNQLSETLYFILESEKNALVDANKKCKKGKPGRSGKPSIAGQGKEGKTGNDKLGKLPNGRQKGTTTSQVGPKEGDGAVKPGSAGKKVPVSELLKVLEEAKTSLAGVTSPKALEEEIKKLIEELLFNTSALSVDNRDFNDRLWETLEAVYNKQQTGNQRDANESEKDVFSGGEEQSFKVIEYPRSALPLPILKQNKK
jgi:hypothetical protein